MRVIGWETRSRNEGELGSKAGREACLQIRAASTGTTRSIPVGTRKMVNYA
jgi:hypothetical protein